MIFNAIFLALRQISRNYLRAFLTMLGVIIGVGAVIIMINLVIQTKTSIFAYKINRYFIGFSIF